jgi:hypothetical protein
MRRMIMRSLALFVSALTLVSLTACASIPRSGTVQQGVALNQTDTTTVEFFPAGPAVDATQEQIVRGFLEAATGPQNDYAVARSYLAPDFQSKWDPNVSVTVDTGVREFAPVAASTATVTVNAVAAVDSTGQYSSATSPVSRTLSYSFVQVQGQWRISSAPAGVIIDRGIFEQVYTTHPLYFFEPSFRYLVPDVRWFARGAATTTRMVKSLLAGPAGWLAEGGAVISSFPAASALVANAVPILKNVAVVDLTSATAGADASTLQRMRQQLTASLQGVNDVASVDIFIDGVPVSQGVSAFVDSVTPTQVDPRPFVVTDKTSGFADGETISPAPVSGSLPEGIRAITLAAGSRSAAVLSPAGVSVVRLANNPAVLDARPGLIAPALDAFNFVWSVPANAPSQLIAFAVDGRSFAVSVPWGNATSIRSLKVSHDGARLLALLETRSGTGATATVSQSLVVAAIIRGDNNTPARVGRVITLSPASGTVVDAAWVDGTTIVSVASTSGDTAFVSATVTTHVIGGKSQNLVGFAQGTPISIAGANTLSQVRILLTDGRLLSLRNNTAWLSTTTGVQVLGTQQ